MTDQSYKEMIHSIIVPANLSVQDQVERYRPLTEYLQTETPERLYRFRRCNEWSIFAFDQDQLGVTPGYKMNDDFDALLYFDKSRIKDNLKHFLNDPQITQKLREYIGQADDSQITMFADQFYNAMAQQLDKDSDYISNLIQRKINFASFSENISSADMWGYYADSSQGFALSYDFRNGNYTVCDSCRTKFQCSTSKNCTLARIIYDDVRFDATSYATWLFQYEVLQRMVIEKNLYSLRNYFENLIPCSDMFMITKILLHKASAWKHEQEWRLICTCNSPDFMQQEFPYATKRPTALYLGRKIKPIYEKILRHIAVEKNIPVYKMILRNHESSYKLRPEIS
ncbi:MAG: DUF2971 domain-containing protein [Oscillibacter sp.]|nr:DUF2971 domain-containing protein [Oscillibacter sp.]